MKKKPLDLKRNKSFKKKKVRGHVAWRSKFWPKFCSQQTLYFFFTTFYNRLKRNNKTLNKTREINTFPRNLIKVKLTLLFFSVSSCFDVLLWYFRCGPFLLFQISKRIYVTGFVGLFCSQTHSIICPQKTDEITLLTRSSYKINTKTKLKRTFLNVNKRRTELQNLFIIAELLDF